MAETVKFPTNIPVDLELKFDTGLECQSQFNGQDQVCYTLTDDRRMYVSPAVARKIADLGVTRGVPFTICKREKQVGMRKTIEWQVGLLEAPATNGGGQTSNNAATEASAVKQSYPTNGNGNGGAPGAPIHPALLAWTGKAAIDIVLEIEAYAREKGMTDFEFGAENIQKIWLSLFIGAQGRR